MISTYIYITLPITKTQHNILKMSKGYDRRECQKFQNSLTYEKIDTIWKHFREAGNSLEGRVNKPNFKSAMTSIFKITNEQFKDKLFQRFRLERFTDQKYERQEIDLQNFAIGLVLISLFSFVDKVVYIFYLTDLDEDGCLSLQEIENMIERIQKIFCKENSSAQIDSFSLLVDNAHKRAQRHYKELLFLLYKNNPGLKKDEGGLITCEQFIQALKGSRDLYTEQRFLPLNLPLAQIIQNVASQLTIRITKQNEADFCKFRKELYTILQKGQQKDTIKYPWRTEIVSGDKTYLLPNTESIVEKDRKQEKVGVKGKGPRAQFKDMFDQKSSDQTLQSYRNFGVLQDAELKVKKMKETKEDPKFNIKFDKIVKK